VVAVGKGFICDDVHTGSANTWNAEGTEGDTMGVVEHDDEILRKGIGGLLLITAKVSVFLTFTSDLMESTMAGCMSRFASLFAFAFLR